MEIVVKEWNVRKEASGASVVAGVFAVMANGKEVTTEKFNAENTFGDTGVDIAMPPELIQQVESLTAQINEAVKASF